MTRFTPNKFRDFYNLEHDADRISAFSCVSEPGMMLPCMPQNVGDINSFAGARSRHPGGVNTLMGDGSVRFVKETVSHPIWIGLSTIGNGEILSADSY